MLDYMEMTNSKLDRLFQRPQREAKWFDIHNFRIECFYENAPIGKNLVTNMLRSICQAAGQPTEWTNHCLRATGIRTLRRLGYQDNEITNVSGTIFYSNEIYKSTICRINASEIGKESDSGGSMTM